MSTLKEKTAKGLGWGFVDNFVGTGITAVVSILLARILSPEEFGLVGMIAIFVSLGNSLMDSGFSGALIRKKEASDRDLSTVFYTNLILSVIIYSALFFSAPAISEFLNNGQLTLILRILALSVVIMSFTQVQKVNFIRKIDFKTQAIISLAASVVSGVVSIWMALAGCGVWSLVVQQLSKQGVVSLLLWVFSTWKPSLIFSFTSFKEMFSFGSKLLACSLISVIWNEIYSLVIGKMYNPIAVGYFTRAEKFKTMVTSNIGQVVQRVGYPVLSSIQDDSQRQVRVYRKVVRLTILLTSTLVLGLVGCADSMIQVLIGAKWLPASDYLRILGISGMFLPLILSSVNVFNANGKSNITLLLEIIKTALAVIPVTLGILFDIQALLWGLVASTILSYLVHALFVSKEIAYPFWRQLGDIIPFILISAVMSVCVHFVGLLHIAALPLLILQILAGFVIVLVSYEFLYKAEEYNELKGEMLKILHRKKK
ncbi:MAG: lipopolysaccharide biosynthesis protein [Bacteroidales bacterium]|nr:lipopolysaccharide biosynthesis protein [Bacteroidales bacterium]